MSAHPLRPQGHRLTVLIVNYNSGRWLTRCVESFFDRQAALPRVLIRDNASTDGSLDELSPSDAIEVDKAPTNVGFAAGINALAERVSSEYMLILNPDCLIQAKAIARLIEELDAHPNAGMVSGRVFGLDGREQRGSRRRLPTPQRVFEEVLRRGEGIDLMAQPPPQTSQAVEAVSGACMMLRTEVFQSLGGLDTAYPMHFEDLDLMAKIAEQGGEVRLVPDVAIAHAGGVSSHHRPTAVLRDKHRGLWRYLNIHCRDQWPRWSRPLWWLGIHVHQWVMTPITWWRAR